MQVQKYVFPLINLERFFPREAALVIKICGRFEVYMCDMFYVCLLLFYLPEV